MDIEEMKTLAKNKIESESLAKQVRDRIKTTAWEKQNQREGFRESFQPLISQFEKPQDDTKNLYTQNQEMLKNQLALTAGIRDNKKAISDGLEKLNFLRDWLICKNYQEQKLLTMKNHHRQKDNHPRYFI